MAHECFEDRETATLMNELFVNIKIDREERPDIDKIYQSAHQLISRSPGGWPLTIFITADGHLPIFTGTYFPPEQFKEVLKRVEAFAGSHDKQIRSQGEVLKDVLAKLDTSSSGNDIEALTDKPIQLAREQLEASFDTENGGFGAAPKFPHPTNIHALLTTWRDTAEAKTPNLHALYMATLTLSRMATRGLYDQLGGGFFRYSVDQRWAIPHFEKMLYDNAALLAVYADAHAATGEELFATVAAETAEWTMRDMQNDQGGYYSTLDADSEGSEGLFYLWTPAQLEELLTDDEFSIASEHYGFDSKPNFEGVAWHLHASVPLDQISSSIPLPRAQDLLNSARAKLLDHRNNRVWPSRDEKILVSWNGLMIKAMARTARVLRRDDLGQSATLAVDFLRDNLWVNGRLLASYKDQRARFPAYLDDYAFLADGLLELLRYRWRTEDLLFACELMDVLIERFSDPRGGFFFTADDHETLIHRPKPFADEATPSGNGIAAQVLLALGHLLGEIRYLDAAEGILLAAGEVLTEHGQAHGTLLRALRDHLRPPQTIVMRGDPEVLSSWQRYTSAGYNPGRDSYVIPTDSGALPGLLEKRVAGDEAVAYVCQGMECRAPVTSLEDLVAILSEA